MRIGDIYYSERSWLYDSKERISHVLSGRIFGILDNGGGSIRWFKDGFRQIEVQEGIQKDFVLCGFR